MHSVLPAEQGCEEVQLSLRGSFALQGSHPAQSADDSAYAAAPLCVSP